MGMNKSDKMKKVSFFIWFAYFLLLLSAKASAQVEEAEANVYFELPQVALVDIEPDLDNSIHFSVNTSAESGESPFLELPANNDLWINYSSSLTTAQNSRSIVAEISQGDIPEGIRFYLEASTFSGAGGSGQVGQPSGRIELNSQPRPIITNIGNCYTGDGINNGHRLSFSIDVSDYSRVYSVDESSFVVLYTITDN
ncbi:hypothetical protein SAMN05444280_105154 [Tangfeifania diversioriginum]|uniref:Uncharacterized protein n=2 Tax=Tangfeifania diversioriginum TaxID=1168035 RepID=A0A1M6DRW6_9BACT|nr:hypothetical protein SAMN05444280_105154 [Tangfeifania diversioriginum]